jgi:hypothetical protein
MVQSPFFVGFRCESPIRLGAVGCFLDRVDIADMATAGPAHEAARFHISVRETRIFAR